MVTIEDLAKLTNHINNNDIRIFVCNVLRIAPSESWSKKASKNHHMVDERGDYGALLHTIRVTKMVIALCDVINRNGIDKDILIASAILHDSCRYGIDGKWSYTLPNHPKLVRELTKKNNIDCLYSEQIFDIIDSHMGKWGEPAFVPNIDSKSILHIADCALARLDVIL